MKLDRTLLEKYGGHGPRYTSYPTAPHFDAAFTAQDYICHAKQSNQGSCVKPLSLYVHIPFCHSLCYYCGCNKIVTPDTGKGATYIEYLLKEMALHGSLYDKQRTVDQIHFGGGTPNFLSVEQLGRILDALSQHFSLNTPDVLETSIEIDPRSVNQQDVTQLIDIGFNRISVGVQDFDSNVQAAVNRIQSDEQVMGVVNAARAAQVDSISIDLIYGLPKQTQDSFNRTLDRVIEFKPDRIALYHYAHMPDSLSAQKLIDSTFLPSSADKLALFELSLQRLCEAGYVYIGMDHFALPEDRLAQGLATGDLHRNFQGYSTHADCDMVGMGVSAISKVDNAFSQNQRNLSAYMKVLDQRELPIQHGLSMNEDDILRADVIQRIMCCGTLNYADVDAHYGIACTEYFKSEIDALTTFADDHLIEWHEAGFSLTESGRLFLRNIAMVFDAYLSKKTHTQRGRPIFSKTL